MLSAQSSSPESSGPASTPACPAGPPKLLLRRDGPDLLIRSPITPFGTPLLSKPAPDVATLRDAFLRGARAAGPGAPFVGTILGDAGVAERAVAWRTHDEVLQEARSFGSALVTHCGLRSGRAPPVGVLLPNCPEWVAVDLACALYSLASVGLYHDLAPAVLRAALRRLEVSVLVAHRDTLGTVFSDLAGFSADLRVVVVVGPPALSPEDLDAARSLGVELATWADFLALGAARPAEEVPPDPSDVAAVVLTSGTGGAPKGVPVRHSMFAAMLAGNQAFLAGQPITAADRTLCLLPLAHIFQRLTAWMVVYAGGSLVFAPHGGDVQSAIAAVSPTVLAVVPRLLARLRASVQQQVDASGALSRTLFRAALSYKRSAVARGARATADTAWDALALRRVQRHLGGRVRLVVCGGAPAHSDLLHWWRLALGCEVVNGYGLSETAGTGCATPPFDYSGGHVGVPVPCVEMRLRDYGDNRVTDRPHPRGELLMRGPVVFSGYFRDNDEHASLDGDGWFATGDIAAVMPEGIRIIDRCRDVFKMATGDWVHPEKLEAVFSESFYLSEILVFGEIFHSKLIVVAAVDPEVLTHWARAHRHPNAESIPALCAAPDVQQMVLADLRRIGAEHGLSPGELPSAVVLTNPWTPANGLLTATFKVRRSEVVRRFRAEINKAYGQGE